MSESFEIEEKQLPDMLIASHRMRGAYSDCRIGFKKVYRRFGMKVAGPAMMLHHDCEYKETDSDFEAAAPIKAGESKDDVEVRTLNGGRCISLKHRGPFESLTEPYTKLREFLEANQHEVLLPSREIYHKGPGMIFKGNPNKYLTEIQFLVK